MQRLLKTSTADARKHFTWEKDIEKYSLAQNCIGQQAYEVLLHLDETQVPGRKAMQVGGIVPGPGALAAREEQKQPVSKSTPGGVSAVDKSNTARKEQSEMERNAKALAEATVLQQAANLAVNNALATRLAGYPQLHGQPPSSSTSNPPAVNSDIRARIEGMVNAFIAKHSIIPNVGFTLQMSALTTISKDTGHTEIQARLLGYC